MAIEPGLYRHYKGRLYEVLGVAQHSETLEQLVVYKAIYEPEGENLWVRPLAMFTGTLVVEGQTLKRFEKL